MCAKFQNEKFENEKKFFWTIFLDKMLYKHSRALFFLIFSLIIIIKVL